jgi:hypothetical protein
MELATLSSPDHFELQHEQIFKCPNCSCKNSGYVEKEASMLTLISSLLAIFMFRFYSLMILPLVIEASKTMLKKCVKCDHILEKKELLSFPSLTDQIWGFKCGGCAIVISRKYAIVLTAILIVIYFFLPASEAVMNPGGRDLVDLKWESYLEDCGRQAILNNGVRAKKNFDSKYNADIIHWKGAIQSKIERNRIPDPHIAEILLIKMNPTDAKIEFPDLQLIVHPATFAKYKGLLDSVEPLDILEFTAVFKRMGDEFNYHTLDLVEIKNTKVKLDWSTLQAVDINPQAKNLRKSIEQKVEEGVKIVEIGGNKPPVEPVTPPV